MGKITDITEGTVLIAVEEMRSPVFTAQMIARELGWGGITSNDYPYRLILRTLHKLHGNNRIGMMNLPGSQNVTVWWDWKRIIDKSIPF